MATWAEFLASLTGSVTTSAPASASSIERLQKDLRVTLPEPLRSVLDESDGIQGEYGLGLVWPCSRIREDNLSLRQSREYRQLYMPFDPLLFFADAGNGDQFAYTILDGSVRRPDIFVWSHEDDSRSWVAPDMRRYLEWWLTGRLTL